MIYLFLGQDAFSKEAQLKALREKFLAKEVQDFNLDILYARELTLKELQKRLLCLPVKTPKRLIVIKESQDLKEEVRTFLLGYSRKPYPQVILILDMSRQDKRDEFANRISPYAKVFRFKEEPRIDSFTLSRSIELRKPDYALKVLSQLLKNGERPERILGGLRFAWERGVASPLETRRRLRLLLNCDRDIKTGRLSPAFALERLIIGLCCLGGPLH